MLPFMGRLEYNLFCTKLDLKWMTLIIWMKFDDLDNTFTWLNLKLPPMDVLPFMGRLDQNFLYQTRSHMDDINNLDEI